MGRNWFPPHLELMKLYICPNYCHIKNAGERGRCPTCNEWLLEAGNDTEEMRQRLQKDAADRQIAYKDKFRNHKIV
jgi:hypothetical protein